MSEDVLDRFVLRARRAAKLHGNVNVLVTSSAVMRSLNRQFRSQDKATDVLSFPAVPIAKKLRRRGDLAGEIAISASIAARNAMRFGHSPAEEIRILTLHGILHLAGFDHERDNGEMARKEAQLRRTLGLPSGLTERSQAARPHQSKGDSPKPRRLAKRATKGRRMA
jgi:probable rRNA maturation factor